MSSSAAEIEPTVKDVRVTTKALEVSLRDGRTLSVPLDWYPRLAHGSPAERQRWRLIADGVGIHWADLDEDVSVSALLSGLPSAESASSLKRWLASRPQLSRGPRKSSSRARRPAKKTKESVRRIRLRE